MKISKPVKISEMSCKPTYCVFYETKAKQNSANKM